MKKFDITTVTLNPSLDISAEFNGLVPEKKSAVSCRTTMQVVGV